MLKAKPPPDEIRDLLDGRFAYVRMGLVVKVFGSFDELRAWMAKRFPHSEGITYPPETALNRAIRRL